MFARLIKNVRLRRWRNKYRVGAQISQFVARDIRRDIQVLDASEVDAGFITVATRTWNVLYTSKGITPQPEFGEPRRVAIENLWKWNGPMWGGPVSDDQKEEEP